MVKNSNCVEKGKLFQHLKIINVKRYASTTQLKSMYIGLCKQVDT